MPEPKRSRRGLVIFLLLVAGGVTAYEVLNGPPKTLTLTGVVTTDDVVVSPLVTARLDKLLVKEGDSVKSGDLLAVLSPGEFAADTAFYTHSADGFSGQIEQNQSSLRYEELQMGQQIRQAQATLASVEAQQAEATANLDNAKTNRDRTAVLLQKG